MTRQRAFSVVRYLLGLIVIALLYLRLGSAWALGLIIALLLLPPLSLCGTLLLRGKLTARFSLPTTAAKNAPCSGTLILENRSRLAAAFVCASVLMENNLTGERQERKLSFGVAPNGTAKCSLSMQSEHCGRIALRLGAVKLTDAVGLFSMRVPLEAAAKLTVIPELFSCELSIADGASAADEQYSAEQRGDDRTEVFQFREYQFGDDLRQIHWKLSAKLDTPIVKIPSQSLERSLLVFWDKREAVSASYADAMAEVTASLCQTLCDNGMPFDLCWTEDDQTALRHIADTDALLQAIPAMVSHRASAECPAPELDGYRRIICITGDGRCPVTHRVTYLICTERELDTHITFAPHRYREQFQRLEIPE